MLQILRILQKQKVPENQVPLVSQNSWNLRSSSCWVEGNPLCGVFLDFCWAQPQSIGQEAMKSIHEDPPSQRGSFLSLYIHGWLNPEWDKQLPPSNGSDPYGKFKLATFKIRNDPWSSPKQDLSPFMLLVNIHSLAKCRSNWKVGQNSAILFYHTILGVMLFSWLAWAKNIFLSLILSHIPFS